MEDTNAGDIQVVDGKDSAYLQVFINVIVIEDRLGKHVRAINEGKVELAPSGIEVWQNSVRLHRNETGSFRRDLMLTTVVSDTVVFLRRRRHADMFRPDDGETHSGQPAAGFESKLVGTYHFY